MLYNKEMPSITTNFDLIEASARNNIPLVGVFYKNRLPLSVHQGAYIFNLADDGQLGTHWTGAFLHGRTVVYFDPFGVVPPNNVKSFFQQYKMLVSKAQIQNINSSICGYYVLYFLWFFTHTRKYSMEERLKSFERLFSTNEDQNGKILKMLLKQLK